MILFKNLRFANKVEHIVWGHLYNRVNWTNLGLAIHQSPVISFIKKHTID